MNSPLSSESALTLLKKVPMEESHILLPPNDDLVTESLHIFQPVRHRHIIIILHKSAGGGKSNFQANASICILAIQPLYTGGH